ncbi:hypothetical protein [Pseudomonas zeae]|uniref:hypothetical protein n=1 Tax=Pseudomonas zeae TaxID=2745510 RepID=UPI0039E0EF76
MLHSPAIPFPVRLPTPTLQQTLDQALHDIARATTAPALLSRVAAAQGFVWALEVAELLSYAQTTTLHARINQAERAAFPRLAGGDQ